MEIFEPYAILHRQPMISWMVQIVVKDLPLCLQKHAKLLQTPWASPTTLKRCRATSGNTPHLDVLFTRAAHKAARYILALAQGATMEIFEPYAMLDRLPRPQSQSGDSQHPLWRRMSTSWYEDEWRHSLRMGSAVCMADGHDMMQTFACIVCGGCLRGPLALNVPAPRIYHQVLLVMADFCLCLFLSIFNRCSCRIIDSYRFAPRHNSESLCQFLSRV